MSADEKRAQAARRLAHAAGMTSTEALVFGVIFARAPDTATAADLIAVLKKGKRKTAHVHLCRIRQKLGQGWIDTDFGVGVFITPASLSEMLARAAAMPDPPEPLVFFGRKLEASSRAIALALEAAPHGAFISTRDLFGVLEANGSKGQTRELVRAQIWRLRVALPELEIICEKGQGYRFSDEAWLKLRQAPPAAGAAR